MLWKSLYVIVKLKQKHKQKYDINKKERKRQQYKKLMSSYWFIYFLY